MCGIVGVIGSKDAKNILLSGLKKLEYRGYDSAGIAVIEKGKIIITKCQGKVGVLATLVEKDESKARSGIGHTRWATHGVPSDKNAHPHLSKSSRFAIVHNGIIENYQEIKKLLLEKGYEFSSETDSEVISHFFEYSVEKYGGDISKSLQKLAQTLKGSFAILILDSQNPDSLLALRLGSPLILGKKDNEYYFASDLGALVGLTTKVCFLEDGQIVTASLENGVKITDFSNHPLTAKFEDISLSKTSLEKEGFSHFMLKEIYEQPQAISQCLSTRIRDGRLSESEFVNLLSDLKKHNRLTIVACGTAYYAGLTAQYWLEEIPGIHVRVEIASEFRYRSISIQKGEPYIFISQSGETADTLAAFEKAKREGAHCYGIVNAIGSSLSRYVRRNFSNLAGPEIGVASTKAFTTQLAVLYVIYLLGLRDHGVDTSDAEKELLHLPNIISEKIADIHSQVKISAKKYLPINKFFLIGRNSSFPIALEGALKLKELAYVHAEGYPAGEMKHGPLALVDDGLVAVAIANSTTLADKMASNINEIKARGGKICAIVDSEDESINNLAESIIRLPKISPHLAPFLSTLVVQLFAYESALIRKCDIDQPRNLAKSVTVE